MTATDGRIVVPDASVILKWVDRLPDEKDRERADALLDAWLSGRLESSSPAFGRSRSPTCLAGTDGVALLRDSRFDVA